jgi:hypothetical protein
MSIGPQLSSVHSSLTELTRRVVELAESQSGGNRDDVASALFEVERALNTANRRLERLVNQLA